MTLKVSLLPSQISSSSQASPPSLRQTFSPAPLRPPPLSSPHSPRPCISSKQTQLAHQSKVFCFFYTSHPVWLLSDVKYNIFPQMHSGKEEIQKHKHITREKQILVLYNYTPHTHSFPVCSTDEGHALTSSHPQTLHNLQYDRVAAKKSIYWILRLLTDICACFSEKSSRQHFSVVTMVKQRLNTWEKQNKSHIFTLMQIHCTREENTHKTQRERKHNEKE